MAKKDPVLVILQLTGGNDYFNSTIPYNDPLYKDNRPAVGIKDEEMILVRRDRLPPQHGVPERNVGQRQDGHHPRSGVR